MKLTSVSTDSASIERPIIHRNRTLILRYACLVDDHSEVTLDRERDA